MDSRPKLETLTSLLFYFGQTDIVYIRKGSRIQEPGWIDLRHAIPQMFQNTLLVQRRGKLVQNGPSIPFGSSFSMLYRPPQLTCPAKDKLSFRCLAQATLSNRVFGISGLQHTRRRTPQLTHLAGISQPISYHASRAVAFACSTRHSNLTSGPWMKILLPSLQGPVGLDICHSL